MIDSVTQVRQLAQDLRQVVEDHIPTVVQDNELICRAVWGRESAIPLQEDGMLEELRVTLDRRLTIVQDLRLSASNLDQPKISRSISQLYDTEARLRTNLDNLGWRDLELEADTVMLERMLII